MPNGNFHRVVAALTVGGALAYDENQKGQATLKPLAGAGIAAFTTNLPDILEPAKNPHHRQLFHSIMTAIAVGYTWKELYEWQPEGDAQRCLRFLLMTGCAAYLIHLALDACTSKSLPLVGKIG